MAKTTNPEVSVSSNESESTLKRSLLLPNYTAALLAKPTIAHPQLRHLISCPTRRGIVYGAAGAQILEFDLLKPQNRPRCMIELEFGAEGPASFSVVAVPSLPSTLLFAAGGLKSQIHISLHSLTSPDPSAMSKPLWKFDTRLPGVGNDIVNAVIFVPTPLTDTSHPDSRSDFRLFTCVNNHHVNVYDVLVGRDVKLADRLKSCGDISSQTNINHASISPDGSTLVLVGDTPNVYLYALHPGRTLIFTEITTYTLPPPPISLFLENPSLPSFFSSTACFASAWSSCGLKFAVASQEGQLCVWDVRSARPIFEYWDDIRLMPKSKMGRNAPDGDIWNWLGVGADGNGTASGVRQVRFTTGSNGQRELLLWTEHTLNLHVIDARTFDPTTHAVFPFPSLEFLQLPYTLSPQLETTDQTLHPNPGGAETELERTPSPSRSQSDWSMHDESAGPEVRYRRRGSSPSPMRVDNDEGAPSSRPQRAQNQTQPIPIPQRNTSRSELVAHFTPPPIPFAPPSLPISLHTPPIQQNNSDEVTLPGTFRPQSPEGQQARVPQPLHNFQTRLITHLRNVGPAGRDGLLAALGSSTDESGERLLAAVGDASSLNNDSHEELVVTNLGELSNDESDAGARPAARGDSSETVGTWGSAAERGITLPLSSLAPLSGSSAEDSSNTLGSRPITAVDTNEDRFRRMEAIIERALAVSAEAIALTPNTGNGEALGSNDTQRRNSLNEIRLRLNMAARPLGLSIQDLNRDRTAVINRIRTEMSRRNSSRTLDQNDTAPSDSNNSQEEGGPDIAGMCLDPTNEWVYVASSAGIVEWRVREREEGGGGSTGGWL